MTEAFPLKIKTTDVFRRWVLGLRDREARQRIARRLERLSDGLLGDARSVGEGVSELKVNYGPGYRLYFIRRGPRVIVLLCGGDKSSQPDDILRARRLAASAEWKDEP